jgi:hypothetical protein
MTEVIGKVAGGSGYVSRGLFTPRIFFFETCVTYHKRAAIREKCPLHKGFNNAFNADGA